jgi:hypothetical protein
MFALCSYPESSCIAYYGFDHPVFFVFQGGFLNGAVLSDFFRFTRSTRQWVQLASWVPLDPDLTSYPSYEGLVYSPTNSPGARYASGSAVSSATGELYLVGGYNKDGGLCSDM